MHEDLTIDRNVRDWVFFPLIILIVLMNILRQLGHQYMNIGQGEGEQNLKDVRHQQIVRRSKRLRMLAGFLTPEAFAKRKAFLVAQDTGALIQEVAAVNMQEKLMSDPSMMTNMMKKQLTGSAPHLAMGFLVNQFFAGFIMGKVPFTLSPRFRSMLQRGIDMASLDVSYFTSLSFYILLLFGLRGLLSLLFAGDVIDESAVMMQQSVGAASPTFDAKSEFKGEKQRFDLVEHRWLIADAEASALEVLQKRLGTRLEQQSTGHAAKDKRA